MINSNIQQNTATLPCLVQIDLNQIALITELNNETEGNTHVCTVVANMDGTPTGIGNSWLINQSNIKHMQLLPQGFAVKIENA